MFIIKNLNINIRFFKLLLEMDRKYSRDFERFAFGTERLSRKNQTVVSTSSLSFHDSIFQTIYSYRCSFLCLQILYDIFTDSTFDLFHHISQYIYIVYYTILYHLFIYSNMIYKLFLKLCSFVKQFNFI